MQINIPRIIAEIAIESYVISLLLFILFISIFKGLNHYKAVFLNNINLLGLAGTLFAFGDDIYFVLKTPKRNSELIIYEGGSFFIPTVGFLLFIMIFFQGKRRRDLRWSFVGLSIFVLIRLSNSLYNWLRYQGVGHKPMKFSVHFFSVTKHTFDLYILFVVGIFAIAWIDCKGGFYNKSPKS